MQTDSQNMGYYYSSSHHMGTPHQHQVPFYGGMNQLMGNNPYQKFNHCQQELNESGLIYSSSQNYCPSYSKNSLHQLNIGSTHALYPTDDNDMQLGGRSRGNSINFMPIPSENFDDNNFYPNGQDQVVNPNFSDLNGYHEGSQSQQNLQPLYQSHPNYLSDDMVGSSTGLPGNSNDMMYPPYNYQYSYPHINTNTSHLQSSNMGHGGYQQQYLVQPMVSQPYLMNDISNLPQHHMNMHSSINNYAYSNQNMPTSLHNLCYEGCENTQMNATTQDEKLSTFQQITDFSKVLESPSKKNKKKGRINEADKVKTVDSEAKSPSYLKSTEKVKRKYTDDISKKQECKEEGSSNDENTPVLPTLLVKRTTSHTPRSKKSKTLSEATTNFELTSELHTPTLKEQAYKKLKIQERENQTNSSCSADQSSSKTVGSEQTIPSTPKNGLLSLPQDKMIDALKNIMKNLPPAYLPFMHNKKLSDSQKLDYIKKHHNIPYQSDLSKIKQLLPQNFSQCFEVNVESVYQNTYIMNGIKQSMPDESQKKIGSLTRKERRERINKYKIKRDKRASCRKVSYDVRKRVADSRLRVKGRFVTKKQALQMIGDFSGNIEKYTNQELRELLLQKFGGESGDRSKKYSMDDDENNISNIINNEDNMIDEDELDYYEEDEDEDCLDK